VEVDAGAAVDRHIGVEGRCRAADDRACVVTVEADEPDVVGAGRQLAAADLDVEP
jgi:hypothetical protein